MTPEQVSELARETAEAEIQDFMSESFREQGCHVQSALTKLAASKDAEIKRLKNKLHEIDLETEGDVDGSPDASNHAKLCTMIQHIIHL